MSVNFLSRSSIDNLFHPWNDQSATKKSSWRIFIILSLIPVVNLVFWAGSGISTLYQKFTKSDQMAPKAREQAQVVQKVAVEEFAQLVVGEELASLSRSKMDKQVEKSTYWDYSSTQLGENSLHVASSVAVHSSLPEDSPYWEYLKILKA